MRQYKLEKQFFVKSMISIHFKLVASQCVKHFVSLELPRSVPSMQSFRDGRS